MDTCCLVGHTTTSQGRCLPRKETLQHHRNFTKYCPWHKILRSKIIAKSPKIALATKSDSPTSPNTVPATQSCTLSSQHHQILHLRQKVSKSDTATSPNTAPAPKSDTPTAHGNDLLFSYNLYSDSALLFSTYSDSARLFSSLLHSSIVFPTLIYSSLLESTLLFSTLYSTLLFSSSPYSSLL